MKWVDLRDFHLQGETQQPTSFWLPSNIERKRVFVWDIWSWKRLHSSAKIRSVRDRRFDSLRDLTDLLLAVDIHQNTYELSWAFLVKSTPLSLRGQCWVSEIRVKVTFHCKNKSKKVLQLYKADFKAKQACKNLVLYYFQDLYRLPPKFA